MGVEGKHGSRLGCIVLLFAPCLSFQTKFSRIPVIRHGLRPPANSPLSQSKERPPTSYTDRNLVPYDPSSSNNFCGKIRNDSSSKTSSEAFSYMDINGNSNDNFVQDKSSSYTLGVSKHYFEQMEERSGKDYRWIKPLTKPVSKVMM